MTRSVWKNVLANGTLMVMSTILTFAALELGYRVWLGPHWLVEWPNFILEARTKKLAPWGRGEYTPDPDIGYVPQASFSSPQYNNDANGLRVTRAHGIQLSGPVVLASGDSYNRAARPECRPLRL
jgi:hypothetical protein